MSARLDHLRALVRLVARGVRARGAPGPVPTAPRRKAAVEKAGITAVPRQVARYLAATGGEGIAAFRGPDAILPPLFPATWETAACLELFAGLEPPLPLGGFVHLEEETTWLRPLPAGERFRCRVELERTERVPRGTRMTVTARNWTDAGVLCSQSTLVFLVRTASREDKDTGGARRPREERPPLAPEPGWREVARWHLRGSDGRRYARASGDYNPIHLWALTARPFGFRRPILHGYCTEARTAHALVEMLWGGDPHALRRLRIAFRSPLPLPSTAALQVRDGTEGIFRITDGAGTRLYAEGSFTGER